ncbi:MAG TPA: YjbE family putative metal transport protein [Ktedonobacterales bacterium]
MFLQLLAALGGIMLVNLVLSGDNALVIGAAAAGLPRRRRLAALVAGGAAATVLRIAFGIAATLLLQLPLLQALGGVILLVIAVRLLAERTGPNETVIAEEAELVPHEEERGSDGGAPHQPAERGFFAALLTILVADVTMSLDNVLAVGALAAGDIPLLALGLVLSIALVLAGSALVAELIAVLPWLLDAAALVLGWTAANMLLHDLRLGPLLARAPWTAVAVPAVCVGLVIAADVWLRLRHRRAVAARARVREGKQRAERDQ